jgi:hypothetical protein
MSGRYSVKFLSSELREMKQSFIIITSGIGFYEGYPSELLEITGNKNLFLRQSLLMIFITF